MSVTRRVVVRGRVQGVFYRASTLDMANELGLRGWVRNCPDGSVEAVFEGDSTRVKEAIEWCRRGPSQARVDGVEVFDCPPLTPPGADFRIRS